jgi:putative inorganic carbon (HCO3(-)) transporter
MRGEIGFRRCLAIPDLGLWCLQAALIGSALLVAPGLLSSAVDLPKRLLVEGLLIAGWGAFLLAGLDGGVLRIRRSPLYAPALSLLGVMAVSALLSINPALGLAGTGLALSGCAAAFLVLSGLDRARLPGLAGALLIAGAFEGVYGLLQYAGIEFLPWASSWGSRCFGTVGNPVFYAEFISPVLVLAAAMLAVERDEERLDLLTLLVTLLFLALLFSQTRSSWLGCLAGLAVVFSCLFRLAPGGCDALRANRNWLLTMGLLGLVVVLTSSSRSIFGKNAVPVKDRIADAVNFKGWSVTHRTILWRAAALELRDRPALGNGPELFGAYFPLKQATFRKKYADAGVHFAPKEAKAHNDYAQAAAETGLLGLGVLVWLLATIGRLGLAAVRRSGSPAEVALAAGMLGGCAATAVDACFNFPFRIVPVVIVFWTFAGGLALLAETGRDIVIPLSSLAAGRRRTLATGGKVAGDFADWRALLATGGVALAFGLWVFVGAVPAIRADRSFAAGERYMRSNMWEMASGFMEDSLERRPYDVLARYEAGTALDKSAAFDWTGRTWDRALRHYRRAAELGLNDELLFGQMALLLEKKGNLDRAIAAAAKAVEIFPEGGDTAANLAYWYSIRENNLDTALELASRAVATFPKHPLYLWMQGLVLEKLGRYREAEAALKAALPNLSIVRNGPAMAPELLRDLTRIRGKLK